MQNLLSRPLVLLTLQLIAFHPVWRWYLGRLTDGSDEPWAILALVTAAVLLLVGGSAGETRIYTNGFWERTPSKQGPYPDPLVPGTSSSCRVPLVAGLSCPVRAGLLLPATLTLLYTATCSFAPNLVQGGIAVASLACTISAVRYGMPIHVPTLGLCLLSLPVVPSMEFFLGYPMRVLSALPAAWFLNAAGFSVAAEAACLRWGTDLVAVDAPCSGVRMLWAGLYLACTTAGILGLNSTRSLITVALTIPAIILGNALRTASLFHLETGTVRVPTWAHDAVGLVVFAATGLAIVWLAHRLSGSIPCSNPSSS